MMSAASFWGETWPGSGGRPESSAIPRQRVADLCVDGNGHLWAAADQGVFMLDEKGWHRIDLVRAKPGSDAVDQKGYMWTGGASQELLAPAATGRSRGGNQRWPSPAALRAGGLLDGGSSRLGMGGAGCRLLTVFDGSAWLYTQDDGPAVE